MTDNVYVKAIVEEDVNGDGNKETFESEVVKYSILEYAYNKFKENLEYLYIRFILRKFFFKNCKNKR